MRHGFLALLAVAACAGGKDDGEQPPSAEQRARRVAELAKPAFDKMQADAAKPKQEGKSMLAPFETLAGLESDWKGRFSRDVADNDIEALVREEVQTEPAQVHRFPDLDLVCWTLPKGLVVSSGKPGWLLMRLLRSDKTDHESYPYHVIYAALHVKALGDVRWGE